MQPAYAKAIFDDIAERLQTALALVVNNRGSFIASATDDHASEAYTALSLSGELLDVLNSLPLSAN
jgi:hypothetical protein